MTAKNKSLLKAIPRAAQHGTLHYLVEQRIAQSKLPSQNTYAKPHPSTFFLHYKNFQLRNRLKGAALSLFKTQFAKKPKNPE